MVSWKESPQGFIAELLSVGGFIAALATFVGLSIGIELGVLIMAVAVTVAAFLLLGVVSRQYEMIQTQRELIERQQELLDAVETVASDD
jgi:ABC-type multidrug transport system fused ATPase/permease subunit